MFSDGSDRQEIEITTYIATVEDSGIQYKIQFDYSPTSNEIISKYLSEKYPNLTPVQLKIQQIKQECAEIIYTGFDSTVKYGELKHYTLKDYEQSNMQALLISIIGGATTVPWRHSELIVCDTFTAQEFQQLYQQAMVFTVNQRYKSDVIELYLTNEELTLEQINSVSLGMQLPQYYEDILIEKLTLVGIPLWQ
jgi:hypothetical protein